MGDAIWTKECPCLVREDSHDPTLMHYSRRGGSLCGQSECKIYNLRWSCCCFREILDTVENYNLCLNLEKCVFVVTSGKLLGFLGSQSDIKVEHDKIMAILKMPSKRLRWKCELSREAPVHKSFHLQALLGLRACLPATQKESTYLLR